jgi:hypothetical protein
MMANRSKTKKPRKAEPIKSSRVRVHYNRTRKCLSVLHYIDGEWKIARHEDRVLLKDVKFVVYESVFKRIQANHGIADVCALVEGIPMPVQFNAQTEIPIRFSKDEVPYFYRTESGEAIWNADFCLIDNTKMYVKEKSKAA